MAATIIDVAKKCGYSKATATAKRGRPSLFMQNVMQALYLTRNARGLPASVRRYT